MVLECLWSAFRQVMAWCGCALGVLLLGLESALGALALFEFYAGKIVPHETSRRVDAKIREDISKVNVMSQD